MERLATMAPRALTIVETKQHIRELRGLVAVVRDVQQARPFDVEGICPARRDRRANLRRAPRAVHRAKDTRLRGSARPKATRWRSPPERLCGRRLRRCAMPSCAAEIPRHAARSPSRAYLALGCSAKPDLLADAHRRKHRAILRHVTDAARGGVSSVRSRSPIQMRPDEEGFAGRQRISSRVVFPQPVRPISNA